MKLLSHIAIGLSFLLLFNCKSTKPKASIKPAATYTPTELQIEMANKRWMNSSEQELKQGQNIYTTKCTACHKNFPVEKFSEKKWLSKLDQMAPKAKLTPEEKTNLTKYLISLRDTKMSPVTK